MAPIPICMCGKQSKLAVLFSDLMLPEYDVVHHFLTTDAFHEEFPMLIRGEDVKPQSGVGSNVESAHPKIPRAIFVGRDFTEEELEDMRKDCDSLPWLAAFPGRKDEARKTAQANPGGPSMMQMVVERVKVCLKDHGLVEGNEDGIIEPGLWRF